MVGQPSAIYVGDDSRNNYIYDFVPNANWDAADAIGRWVALSLSNALISGYAAYKFAGKADIASTRD